MPHPFFPWLYSITLRLTRWLARRIGQMRCVQCPHSVSAHGYYKDGMHPQCLVVDCTCVVVDITKPSDAEVS